MSQALEKGKGAGSYEFKGRVQGLVVLGPRKSSWGRQQESYRNTRNYPVKKEWKEHSGQMN